MKTKSTQTVELSPEDLAKAVEDWVASKFGHAGQWRASIDCHRVYRSGPDSFEDYEASAKVTRVVEENETA